MELIKIATSERLITDSLIRNEKIELFKIEDYYLIIYRRYYSDEPVCSSILSETYMVYNNALDAFDKLVESYFND